LTSNNGHRVLIFDVKSLNWRIYTGISTYLYHSEKNHTTKNNIRNWTAKSGTNHM